MALVSIPVDGCNLEVCEDVRKPTTQEGEEDWDECGKGGGQMVRWRAGKWRGRKQVLEPAQSLGMKQGLKRELTS